METVMGEGGQYQSFEAVFGRRDENGKPEQFFNRNTGRIFPDAIDHWRQYDINRLIISNAGTLKSVIDGKINITVADNDDFFLDGSVKLLKHTLDSLSIRSEIRVLPDGGHNAWNDEIRTIMHTKMDSVLLKAVGFN
jgi:S-formylglutathione hydrolase FrmB